jgi:hypothetical protein
MQRVAVSISAALRRMRFSKIRKRGFFGTFPRALRVVRALFLPVRRAPPALPGQTSHDCHHGAREKPTLGKLGGRPSGPRMAHQAVLKSKVAHLKARRVCETFTHIVKLQLCKGGRNKLNYRLRMGEIKRNGLDAESKQTVSSQRMLTLLRLPHWQEWGETKPRHPPAVDNKMRTPITPA